MPATIIDTHAHLYDCPEPEKVLEASAAGGVSDIVLLGVDLPSNQRHLDMLCRATPCRLHPGFGLHPGNITTPRETEDCLEFMRQHLKGAVAVGEIGLDYHYKWVKNDDEKKKEQQDVFARQLMLAKETGLPAVIHSRGAYREALDMTLAEGVRKAEFHWYTGPEDVLKDILDAGFMVSVSPSLEYSPEAKAVARYVPLDRLLVETDTPVRGWKPVDAWRTLRLLSAEKGVAEANVLDAVNGNARAFFGLL